MPVELLLKARLRIGSPPKGTHGNLEFPGKVCRLRLPEWCSAINNSKAGLEHEQLFLGRTTLSKSSSFRCLQRTKRAFSSFPSLDGSVFLQYLSGFFNRQRLDRVSTSARCCGSEHGIVDRLLG